MFRIPYYQNDRFIAGIQLYNAGSGGPQSHMGMRAIDPRSYPTCYNVATYGMHVMPRQVIGPTAPVVNNAYSNPLAINNLEIAGLFKSPIPQGIGQ